jgi:hypothetical protein
MSACCIQLVGLLQLVEGQMLVCYITVNKIRWFG